jgi:hypothetical protein
MASAAGRGSLAAGVTFPRSYAEARQRFRRAAAAAGAALDALPLAGRGREGEALAIDIARLGSGGPALLILSGLHGVEGFAGSVVQARWLARARDAAGMTLVFVHAVNPWGFSWGSRCDARNVDLNRNLLEDFAPPPANPGYAAIHPILAAPAWGEAALARQEAALADYAARHGAQALTDAMIGGQYDIADGLNYGGDALAWPVRMLCDLASDLARRHLALLLLDLHTGIARHGEAAVLPFAGATAPAARHLLTAGGDARFSLGAPGLASMTGVLAAGLPRRVAPVPMLSAVVEFGTVDRAVIRRALRLDLALRVAPPADPALAEAARAQVVEAFWPSDPAWRAGLLSLADALIEACTGEAVAAALAG